MGRAFVVLRNDAEKRRSSRCGTKSRAILSIVSGKFGSSMVYYKKEGDSMPQEDFAAIYRNPTYDQHAKRLLSQRIIMARLLKRIVPEFKDVEIADIAEKYIEGKPQIGDVPMERDKTNAVRNGLGYPREIFGDATENIGVTEGCIRFDILFHARVPQGRGGFTCAVAMLDHCSGLPLSAQQQAHFCSFGH